MNHDKSFQSLQGKTILVTGVAGFIASHIVEKLLQIPNVKVVGIDNFLTGRQENVSLFVGHPQFTFFNVDITDFQLLNSVVSGVDIIIHQAALGSVPRSIKEPLNSHANNVSGFINVLEAARLNGVKRVVYASSSSVYGDNPVLPKTEADTGNPLSPYAVTKKMNEIYADIYGRCYGLETLGLRYFNVFGPRQDPSGPYAAVIPLFIEKFLRNEAPIINGDGKVFRDFTFVDNVVQVNLLAATTTNEKAFNKAFNVACGEKTTLNELTELLKTYTNNSVSAIHGPERFGDIKESLADISFTSRQLGYQPEVLFAEGLKKTVDWYFQNR